MILKRGSVQRTKERGRNSLFKQVSQFLSAAMREETYTIHSLRWFHTREHRKSSARLLESAPTRRGAKARPAQHLERGPRAPLDRAAPLLVGLGPNQGSGPRPRGHGANCSCPVDSSATSCRHISSEQTRVAGICPPSLHLPIQETNWESLQCNTQFSALCFQ